LLSSTDRWRRPFILARRVLSAPLTLGKVLNVPLVVASYLLSRMTRRPIILGRPFMLMLEPSSLCNLHCPLCAVGAGRLTRPQGHMPLKQFIRILDEMGPHLLHLTLWNQGEPFLNPHLVEMIRYAKARKMTVLTSTNGHYLDRHGMAESLVRSGLDDLIVSLDGVSSQTYRGYRKGGDLHRVLRGIRTLVQAKKRLRSSRPFVELQFLIMKHNQHEIEPFRALAKTLGVDRISLKTLQVETLQEARQFLPRRRSYRRYRLDGGTVRLKGKLSHHCRWIWFCPVINSDGTVCPCCFDKDNQVPLGNAFNSQPLVDIWHGQPYQFFRRRILTARERIPLCQNCSEGLTRLVVKKEAV
jgi:MoaA/NifB/PqqE/SkfB family radical SAM enzyme